MVQKVINKHAFAKVPPPCADTLNPAIMPRLTKAVTLKVSWVPLTILSRYNLLSSLLEDLIGRIGNKASVKQKNS